MTRRDLHCSLHPCKEGHRKGIRNPGSNYQDALWCWGKQRESHAGLSAAQQCPQPPWARTAGLPSSHQMALCRWTLRWNLVIYLILLTVMNSGYTGFKFCILLTSCIRVFQRNRTNRISVSIWIPAYLSVYPFNCQEIYFKELIHTLVRPGKFEICKPSWQPGDSGKSWGCSLESEGWERRQNFCCSLEAEFFLQETAVFALKAFTWLDKAHHIMEG